MAVVADITQFNLQENEKAARKLLVTAVNVGDSITAVSGTPEWQIVGLMGKLYVRDNGTCVVNGYAGVSNGIAIKSDNKTNMRVMERVNDTVIRVLLK